MSDAFDKVVYHGKLMDKKTRAFIQEMEKRLKYDLTITQGCYNPGGVSASAGTHDKGGVVDLAAWDRERKIRVAKDLGAFVWYRPAIPGLWGEHIHLGIRFHGNLAPAAQAQQRAYDNRRNGLKSNLPDPTYRAKPPVVFQYPVKEVVKLPHPTQVSMTRDSLVEADHALGEAIAHLSKASASRVHAREQIPFIKRSRQSIRAILEELPKR